MNKLLYFIFLGIVSIGELSAQSDISGILIPYNRLVEREVIYADSCEISVVYSTDNSIEYMSCNDPTFCIEGVKPGSKIPDKLKGKDLEYLRGWGYFVNITGNWYAGFDINKEPTDTSAVLYLFWFNFHSKHTIERMSVYDKDCLFESYYNKSFVLADNDETLNLLTFLTSSHFNEVEINNAINIFLDICRRSDGALAEVLVYYAIIMLEKYPNQIISKMGNNEEIQSIYIHNIATYFYYNHITAETLAFDIFFNKIGKRLGSQAQISVLSKLKPRVKEALITISD